MINTKLVARLCGPLPRHEPTTGREVPLGAKRAWRTPQGEDVVEVHSEAESYRRVLPLHTPDGHAATVIVLRRKSAVWLTFDGAVKTTVVMTTQESGHLIEAVTEARGA